MTWQMLIMILALGMRTQMRTKRYYNPVMTRVSCRSGCQIFMIFNCQSLTNIEFDLTAQQQIRAVEPSPCRVVLALESLKIVFDLSF